MRFRKFVGQARMTDAALTPEYRHPAEKGLDTADQVR
jgi:hypothetical protein